MTDKDWNELLICFSPTWREFIVKTEMSAYEAIESEAPNSTRRDIPRYTVMLAMLSILLYHRPEMLRDFDGKGIALAGRWTRSTIDILS